MKILCERVTVPQGGGGGEVFASPYAAGAFLKSNLASTILGQPAQKIGPIWHDMVAKLGYGRRGAAMMAVSAVDMARGSRISIDVNDGLGESLRSFLRQVVPNATPNDPVLVST